MPLIAIPPRTSGSGIVIAVRWPPAECPEMYSRVGAVLAKMFGEPPDGAAHLVDNTIEPGRRGQGVFDDREIDPERKQGLGEEGEILLYDIVYLPITAVDKGKRRRLRVGGENKIEPLAWGIAVGK